MHSIQNLTMPLIYAEFNNSISISFGIYCLLLFFISIVSNSIIIKIFIKNKKLLKNSNNVFLLTLTSISLAGTVVELPIVGFTIMKNK